jgi:dTMP kinase
MPPFITFEGVEGCGKSTQARRLYRRLRKLAVPVLLTHEPGITALGKRITRVLKWTRDVNISPMAELLLFNTSRIQHVTEVIRPALENGTVVICDRYADSSTAYQGYGRGLDLETVAAVNRVGTAGLVPDLTILLDMPAEAGIARIQGNKPDRFEGESLDFHRRIREGFLKLADKEPERWVVIDAQKDKEEIAEEIWDRVSKLLPRK